MGTLPRPKTGRAARPRPLLAALGALVAAALAATGCVSMPSGGPVFSYPVTQGTAAQNQPYVQIQPQQPGANWTPKQIVQGFLTASASYGNDPQVVLEYLTPQEQKFWNPSWSAVVYKSGPDVKDPSYSPGKNPTATVGIAGTIQANLQGYGNYSVPSAAAPGTSPDTPEPFQLTKVGGQWRISSAPSELLLTSNSFENVYQLRNLYFFDPQTRFLVPDPVYVPVRTGDLMDGLVNELIAQPEDWLSSGATTTAFPAKTKVSGVTLDGGVTAVVNLTGTAIGKADNDVMEQVWAQLWWTLNGVAPSGSTGPGVQSVEVVVNGKAWTLPNGQGTVQSKPLWSPPSGASNEYYYITSEGWLASDTVGGHPVMISKIGTGYTQIAVSADGTYVAALRGTTLYTGLVDGALTKRGTGFGSVSWDADDDLWGSQGDQIVMFRGTHNARQPLSPMVDVDVENAPLAATFTTLQVAPDGVRVALVTDGELTFGAISRQTTQSPKIELSPVQYSPQSAGQPAATSVNFTAVTWYGSDDVIALAEPGPSVTDYQVSGGGSTSIQAEPDMQTITASYKHPLILGLPNGHMMSDASLTGSWMTINNGDTPASGSSPVYPG